MAPKQVTQTGNESAANTEKLQFIVSLHHDLEGEITEENHLLDSTCSYVSGCLTLMHLLLAFWILGHILA